VVDTTKLPAAPNSVRAVVRVDYGLRGVGLLASKELVPDGRRWRSIMPGGGPNRTKLKVRPVRLDRMNTSHNPKVGGSTPPPATTEAIGSIPIADQRGMRAPARARAPYPNSTGVGSRIPKRP
jgi:hypothetical protein